MTNKKIYPICSNCGIPINKCVCFMSYNSWENQTRAATPFPSLGGEDLSFHNIQKLYEKELGWETE